MACFPGSQRTPVNNVGLAQSPEPDHHMLTTSKCSLLHAKTSAHGGGGHLLHLKYRSDLITHQRATGTSLPCSAMRVVEAAAAVHGALSQLSGLGEPLAEEADAHAARALKACEGCLGRRACGVEALTAGAPASPCVRAGSRRKRDRLLALGAYVSSAGSGPCTQVHLLCMPTGGGFLESLLKRACELSPFCCRLCCHI